jgi:hypothetical protein
VEIKNVTERARTLQTTLADREASLVVNKQLIEELQADNSQLSRKLADFDHQEQVVDLEVGVC